MGIISDIFGKRAKERAIRLKIIKKLDGRAIKYVIERLPDDEFVIGRSGALILKGDELLVYADEKVLFRADINTLDASELLSREGVILTAPDLEHGGATRTIVAYYTYFMA